MLFLDQQIIKLHEMCFDWLLGFWKVSVVRCWCLYKGCLTDKSPFSVSCVAGELQIWPELDQRSGLDPSWFPQGRACSPGSRTGACWWSQYWWGHRKISANDDGEEIYRKVVHLFSKLSVCIILSAAPSAADGAADVWEGRDHRADSTRCQHGRHGGASGQEE